MVHRTRIAAVLATLVAAVLLTPSSAVAADSSLDDIYAALRPQNLRTSTGATTFVAGDAVEFSFDLANTSNQPLVIPLYDFFGRSFHLVGTEQSWIERLGPYPTIPGIPSIIGRKGNWYASGGAIIAVEGLPANTVPAGASVQRGAGIFYSTAGFPSGTYRFYLEYKPVLGGLFDVIATTSIDLTFVGTSSDTTPPVLTAPSDLTVEATSAAGAVVSYSASGADDVDGDVPVTCSPPSGTTFPLGTTNVQCIAMDAAGNGSSAAFNVRVVDTTLPALTIPNNIEVDATSSAGRVVGYSVTAADIVDPSPRVTCNPPPDSLFAIGNTTVSCTATDAAENRAEASFLVHVKGAAEQVGDLLVLVDSYGLGKLGSSLHDKLVTVQRFLAAGKPRQAEDNLASFIAQVDAQAGKGLSQDQADALKTAALRILDVIEG